MGVRERLRNARSALTGEATGHYPGSAAGSQRSSTWGSAAGAYYPNPHRVPVSGQSGQTTIIRCVNGRQIPVTIPTIISAPSVVPTGTPNSKVLFSTQVSETEIPSNYDLRPAPGWFAVDSLASAAATVLTAPGSTARSALLGSYWAARAAHQLVKADPDRDTLPEVASGIDTDLGNRSGTSLASIADTLHSLPDKLSRGGTELMSRLQEASIYSFLPMLGSVFAASYASSAFGGNVPLTLAAASAAYSAVRTIGGDYIESIFDDGENSVIDTVATGGVQSAGGVQSTGGVQSGGLPLSNPMSGEGIVIGGGALKNKDEPSVHPVYTVSYGSNPSAFSRLKPGGEMGRYIRSSV